MRQEFKWYWWIHQEWCLSSRVSDIIVDACAKILCISTVAISSIDNMAVTLHRRQLSQISSNHLYLPYNEDEPRHYDGTKELTQEDVGRRKNEK